MYEEGSKGEIIQMSKKNITRTKYYILKPVLVLQVYSQQHKNSHTAALYFSRREEVLYFFSITNRKLRWAFLNNKPLLHSYSNINYLITRIF